MSLRSGLSLFPVDLPNEVILKNSPNLEEGIGIQIQ